MNKETLDARAEKAKELLVILTSKGLSIPQIAELMENGTDKRTLYRWLNGQSKPQRSQDIELLERLVNKL